MIERKKKNPWRAFAGAAIVLSVAAIAGQGVLASLNATAFNTVAQNVDAGTMKLNLAAGANSAGFTSNINLLAPGDVVNRYVTLTNNGSLDGKDLKLTVAATSANSVIVDATKGLKLTVLSCNQAWDVSTGLCNGAAGTTEIAQKAVGGWNVTNLASGTMNSGDLKYLKMSLQLPDQNETTVNGVAPATSIQGATAALTYTFDLAQRAATTTNS